MGVKIESEVVIGSATKLEAAKPDSTWVKSVLQKRLSARKFLSQLSISKTI